MDSLWQGSFGFDIAWWLTMLTAGSSVLALLGAIYRYSGGRKAVLNKIGDFFQDIFWPLVLVWLIRSFVVQPYKVPTGSLMPTVYPGDYIVVQQFAYGLRWPLDGRVLWPVGKPERGDLALFHAPNDLTTIYVKRVIGVPGDEISYLGRELFINGRRIKRRLIGEEYDESSREVSKVERYQEFLPGEVTHDIYLASFDCGLTANKVRIPEGYYFMMGDNRDNSFDSRAWGLVPDKLLIGKAVAIWFSWDDLRSQVRWSRLWNILR